MEYNLPNLSSNKTGAGNQGSEIPVKVLILGSGSAGLTAALYTARANLQPVVLTGMELGGQVAMTFTVENFPGFPDGVSGSQLVESFQKQAEKFGARIEFDTAIEVDCSRRPFRVKTYNTTYLAKALIVATGATPRRLNVPGEAELTGRGVSYCATCDGYFFRDKEVVVVGGGDSAVEEGLFLTRYARSVTFVQRRDTVRAGAVLQGRAKEHPKIYFIWNSIVTKIQGSETVTGVRLKNLLTGEETDTPTDGVFIFIGHSPNTALFKGQLDMDETGYLKIDHLMRAKVPGIFVAGEASDPYFRQVITSAGAGAAAAIQAGRFLDAL